MKDSRATLSDLFLKQNLKLAFAESCTGGKISGHLCEWPGISAFFMGSLVSYANDVKFELLGVTKDSWTPGQEVSAMVALQMAVGAQRLMHADWALSCTGYAGPAGGSAAEPLGSIWIAIVGPSFEVTKNYRFAGNRVEIQNAAVDAAMQLLVSSVISHSS